jgi:hypothetical protein
MALEDRIRSSVDQAVQGLVSELLSASHSDAAQQVADTEGRLRAEFDKQIAELRDREQQAVSAAQTAIQADYDRQLSQARQQAAEQVRLAIAEAESRAAETVSESVAAARVRERELEMAGLTRLVESIRGLDGATSLSEVLDALALAAGREAARAAVVVLKGDRVQGWRLSGFGPRDAQPKSIDMTLAEAGIIAQAATGARPVTTRDSGGDAGPGFETLADDRMGMAMPVLIGGKVVAVVYADSVSADGHERSVPSAWPEVIEILARHAGRCLEALTSQKTAGTVRSRTAGAGHAHPAAGGAAEAESQPLPGAAG